MTDFARITVHAGNGGNGSGSRMQIKGKRYGKADGGDGGRGGDVYFEATTDLTSLEPFAYLKDFAAESGKQGFSNLRRGANADDLVLKVPVGTQLKIETGDMKQNTRDQKQSINKIKGQVSYDLIREGERILIARGGVGGRGNAHLRDELGHRPRYGENGGSGEVVNLTLELKLIAQVGLIGLPNAGKSTLLAALTNAKPEVAAYPFTTLEPNLGVLGSSSFMVNSSSGNKTVTPNERYTINNKRLIIADIPGLIEGAHRGRGLGHNFLRHIERTKLLVHLVDVSRGGKALGAGTLDVGSLVDDYEAVRNELDSFSSALKRKREIIVLSKVDLLSEEQVKKAVAVFKAKGKQVFPISASSGKGLQELIQEIAVKSKV